MAYDYPRKLTIPRVREARLSLSYSTLTTDTNTLTAGTESALSITGANGITVQGTEGAPDALVIDGAGVGAAIDHGGLLGLDDDDHNIYLTTARHDAIDSNPHDVMLNELGNPDGNKDFTMSNKLLGFRYTAPTPAGAFSGAFEIEATGGFTGDLFHVHQHTGNVGATRLVAIEADDADCLPLRTIGVGTHDALFTQTIRIAALTASQIVKTDANKGLVSAATIDHGTEVGGLDGDDHAQYHTDARGDARYYTEAEVDAIASGINHGDLENIGANDHHNETHNHDDRYYTEAEVITIASGINHGDLENLGNDDHPQYLLVTDIDDIAVDGETVQPISSNWAFDHAAEGVAWVLSHLGTDSHHAQSHTIASHSDTTGTGAELDELTDGSETALHTHAGGVHDPLTVTDTPSVNLTLTTQLLQADVTASGVDHGLLAGLGDDDHSIYHTDARGDARYYTETELDAGQLDNRYYTETEVDTLASGINHGDLENLDNDDHSIYLLLAGRGGQEMNDALTIIGSADTNQLVVKGNAAQANSNPLILLKDSNNVEICSLHTDDRRNVFVGIDAGKNNSVAGVDGIQHVFMGSNAGVENTSGASNFALGAYALRYNETGDNNIAIGPYAGEGSSGDSQTGNVWIGAAAGISIQANANSNVGIGGDSLHDLTTGNRNICVGFASMYKRAASGYGTAIGYGAGYWCTGNNITAIGYQAAFGASGATGKNSVFIGYEAGRVITSSEDNVVIGYRAGYVVTTGDDNTFIGNKAGYTTTTGSNNILIGDSVNATADDASNELNIGDAIYGNLTTKDVGIGIAAPSFRLDVRDDVASSYTLFAWNDGNNANRYVTRLRGGADDGSGTTYFVRAEDGDATLTGYIQTVAGVFALADVSDQSLKQDIADSKVNGLDIINQLETKEFRFRKQGPTAHLHPCGFVAQQCESVFPEMVGEGEDGTKTTSRSALIPVLVKAVQELSAEVESLKEQLDVI